MSAVPQFQKLFDEAPFSCLAIDPDFMIIAVTDNYLQVTSTKREQLLGRNLFSVFPDNPGDSGANGVANLMASLNIVKSTKMPHRMDIQKYDIRMPEGNFEVRYWSPYNKPVLNEKGEVLCILHRVEDVTEFIILRDKDNNRNAKHEELKNIASRMAGEITDQTREIKEVNVKLLAAVNELEKLSDELKRSNEDLENFAMIASHDIQAPFRLVGQFLQLIKEKLEDKGIRDCDAYFKKIEGARERIRNLLEDLLQISLISNGQQPIENVDLKEIWNDVLNNLEQVITEAGAKVTITGELPVIKAIPSQMLQLFQNLITNGVKFNRTGTPLVEVNVSENPREFVFEIKDNGVGIETEYFDKIFQVFERLNARHEFPGTGLGLAICKRIVDNHGGRLWVDSKVGIGTTFFFTLPQK